MNKKTRFTAYGALCSLFYDATKKYAPEKEVTFYASFIEQNPGRVLEAMSGSGRLQIPLLQRGYTVDGVDNSLIMLDRCRARCAELNITPILYEQSLENLQLKQKYTTITIAVGSFQLIIDRSSALQALKNLHAHMSEQDNLLIDIFVPDTSESQSVRSVHIDQHSEIRLRTRYIFYPERQQADAFCSYDLLVDGKVPQQETELIQVVWYSDNEITQLLNEAGFTVIKIYDVSFKDAHESRVVHAQAIVTTAY